MAEALGSSPEVAVTLTVNEPEFPAFTVSRTTADVPGANETEVRSRELVHPFFVPDFVNVNVFCALPVTRSEQERLPVGVAATKPLGQASLRLSPLENVLRSSNDEGAAP